MLQTSLGQLKPARQEAPVRMSELSSIGPGHVPPTNPARSAGSLNGVAKPTPAHQRNGDAREPGQPSPAQPDRIELSDHARLAELLGKDPEVRSELVAKMRRLVNDPEYLTDQKLGAAIERMIEEIEENNAY